MRIGILVTHIRAEEKLLIQAFQARGIEPDILLDRDINIDLTAGGAPPAAVTLHRATVRVQHLDVRRAQRRKPQALQPAGQLHHHRAAAGHQPPVGGGGRAGRSRTVIAVQARSEIVLDPIRRTPDGITVAGRIEERYG